MRVVVAICVTSLIGIASATAWAAEGGLLSAAGKPIKSETKTAKSTGSSPTIVSSVSSGTKKLVHNTANLFTPKKATPVRKSGTTAIHPAQPKEQPSVWSRMFNSEPPPPPKTVKEWMSLKRPSP